MKKTFSFRLLPTLCLVASLVLNLGCGGDGDPDPVGNCDNFTDDYESTLNAYISDPTNKTKCLAFKSAAADLLDCPHLTAGHRKEYQDAVNSIDCD